MCTYFYLPERSQEGHIEQEIDTIGYLQVIDRLEDEKEACLLYSSSLLSFGPHKTHVNLFAPICSLSTYLKKKKMHFLM